MLQYRPMLFDMDKNIQSANTAEMLLSDATKPLLVVSKLVGMNPKSKWYKVYSVFILVCELLLLCWIWHDYSEFVNKNDNFNFNFNVLIHGLEDVCRMTSLVFILGSGLYEQKRFMVPLKDFASVDQCLESLNGFMDNKGTYRFQISLIIHAGLMLLLLELAQVSLYIFENYNDEIFCVLISNWIHQWIFAIVCTTVDCFFSSILSIIKKRFKEINLLIHCGGKQRSNLQVDIVEISSAQIDNSVLKDLRILRKQYHDLWGIANRINETYGPHLLLGATTSLALIISNLWISYSLFTISYEENLWKIGVCILWVTFYIVRIFHLVKVSELTVAEAKAASVVLQELGMKEDYDRVTKDEIRDFLIQLQLEVRKFTACGFFDVDFSLMGGILGAACTYLVILIQMDHPNTYAKTGHSNESIHLGDKVHS